MRKLIPIVACPSLVAEIIGQFVFMALMAHPNDKNFIELQYLDLNDIFTKADQFFGDLTDVGELIMADEVNLSEKLTEFLQEWAQIVDITAMQQNIHHRLEIHDK